MKCLYFFLLRTALQGKLISICFKPGYSLYYEQIQEESIYLYGLDVLTFYSRLYIWFVVRLRVVRQKWSCSYGTYSTCYIKFRIHSSDAFMGWFNFPLQTFLDRENLEALQRLRRRLNIPIFIVVSILSGNVTFIAPNCSSHLTSI